MLTSPIEHEKSYGQLVRCLEHLSVPTESDDELVELIFSRLNENEHSTSLYQAFFALVLGRKLGVVIERMAKIVADLLFDENEVLFQWDKKDAALHFLDELIGNGQRPSWLDEIFVRRVIERLLHHTNEYVQAGLINLLVGLVRSDLLSPLDPYLSSILVQFTDESLGDVVRCALAHAWLILVDKSREKSTPSSYRIVFAEQMNATPLADTVSVQIPRLIGDAGQETERQCLRLIESIAGEGRRFDDVLHFLAHDGCSEQIQRRARQLLFPEMNRDDDKETRVEHKSKERFEDELASILHWFEHPDEHMTLDCD